MHNYSYRRKEWQAFRVRCLKRANHRCEKCDRSGVILQVHHPEYDSGREPWEYEVDFCEVLCRYCHAEEHGKVPPSTGWRILYSDLDQNRPSDPVACALCDKEIRWHFTVHHSAWGEMVVGSECAKNLSLGMELVELQAYQRKLRTFIASPRWRPTPKGFTITYKGYKSLAFRSEGGYQLKINGEFGKLIYPSLEDAKAQAFVKLQSLLD